MRYTTVFLLCLVWQIAIAEEHWQKPEYIVQSFLEVALGSEFGGAKEIVHKWVKPVRILVTHQVGDEALHETLLDAHIAHLILITGHDIKRVQRAEQANVRLFFTRESLLIPLIKQHSGEASAAHERGAICLAGFRTNVADEIASASIYIPVDRARQKAKLLACIVEELTQVMGLPRDSDRVYPSVFNDKTPDDLLTGLDDILLRVLYDPRMRAGLNRKQVLNVTPDIVKDLDRQGLIKNAAFRVRKQGALYRYYQ
ncbi:DUF2927 domain-containing protein [Neptunomonas antarctica]|uniref:DUF2927 domain-containing protein n=1 Tax=Neptunomonas antarctica TaxID=619304 RepID=A0A1N7J2P4_9GAMM|nr:DUF2927 domain-containing protein [Neptunomonas antarctica]SIS43574.1 Protein of unknown function [Neptunomonas antarctica]